MKNSSFISWSSYGRHFYRSIYISIIFEISSKELLFVCTKIIITFNIFDLFKLNYLIIQKMLFYSTNYKLWIPFRYVLISFITEYYGRKLCNVGVHYYMSTYCIICAVQIHFLMNLVMSICKKKRKFLCFYWFLKQAFDTVWRNDLWYKLIVE